MVRGRSAVDQAVLTGESMPVDKGEDDPVFTGTVNQFGRLEVRAEKLGAETTLGQVIRLLADAHRHRSPLERTADRYARRFLPAVLAATVLVFLATNGPALWRWIAGGSGGVPRSTSCRAVAVLVVACPCALVLATPAAILAATARLARRGVLVKGGAAIEGLARVEYRGLRQDRNPHRRQARTGRVHRVLAWSRSPPAKSSRTSLSRQPNRAGRGLAAGRRGRAAQRASPGADAGRRGPATRACVCRQVDEFQAQPARGSWPKFRLGRKSGADTDDGPGRQPPTGPRARGRACRPEVERGDRGPRPVRADRPDRGPRRSGAGVIGARDRVRPQAHDVIHDLKHLGLKDLAILTGDRDGRRPRPWPGRSISSRSRPSSAPAGKAEWIDKRRQDGRVVAMVGDGINDAPALARADVGLALAGVGSDLAAEAGSVVLMGDPLTALPETIRLARHTVRIIRQNILLFAFGLNALAVVLAGLARSGAGRRRHRPSDRLAAGAAQCDPHPGVRALADARGRPLRCAGRLGLPALPALDGSRRTLEQSANGRCGPRSRLGALAYLASGITVIGPDQVGVLRRFGRYHAPLLRPGLHVRMPAPIETRDRGRARSIASGPGRPDGPDRARRRSRSPGAPAMACARDESALFFTGDENLVELAGVVEYHFTRPACPTLLFTVADVDQAVAAAAEGVFREETGRTPLEAILVGARREFEVDLAPRVCNERLDASGLAVVVDRVRVVDAHPPREVVPAYRDVSAAVSDAERSLNQARADAAQRRWAAQAEAEAIRDAARTRAARLVAAQTSARKAHSWPRPPPTDRSPP